jgi:hypothetical protein
MKKSVLPTLLLVSILFLFIGGSYLFLKNSHKKINIDSTVVKLYRDYNNHGSGTILLKNKKHFSVKDSFYYKIRIGDSIIKDRNNTVLKVIRRDSIFF